MYPFLHLLPNGSLFIFADRSSEIFDVSGNRTVKTMPMMPGMHRTYPNTGGSVMLPLRKENRYEAEIMICGGGSVQEHDSLCDASCGRLKPTSQTPTWEMTTMPEPRGMVEGLLLLDGNILWINGCQRGSQGFGLATAPALEALIYNPRTNEWAVSGRTRIARLYHSVAMMLLDGTVLIAGSNPNEQPLLESEVDVHDQSRAFPTEFRVEIYTPAYLRGAYPSRRPTDIRLSTLELDMKTRFSVEFDLENQTLSHLDIILYAGGFITHSLHMGQVMVYLDHSGWGDVGEGRKRVEVDMPGVIQLAPGPYVVYVVANGVPGVGQFVTLKV
ncbi:hypothetical protein A1O3_07479 [Capronia epimyces CBS 606.96]|uniref:Galactose oxidase-like Early set domain-containing protein n=1 Tax=Capronia epimyces CBS 606.96 TaxID=1182542 RepID=W9YFW3_9EURO|nr:uncharacterized protein A1O3_07479 [Capronia epimyces CBS 606.96]EXJ81189.1 hypothetical protein A1O3_07479 [Capronia epimyces CBS 606.96]